MKILPQDTECVDFSFDQHEQQEPISSEQLPRRDQRALVFHLLYAMDAFDYETSLASIADNFSRGFLYILPLDGFVYQHAKGVIEARDELDQDLRPLLAHWRLERLSTCTRLIMRLGIWELKYTDTDPSVIINEAVELAKCFAEIDAYRFVNGVLDEWVKRTKDNKESSSEGDIS